MPKIDEQLNFVIPVERADGRTVYVHAMPISRETFDTYFLVIGQTFTMITAGKLGVVGGPRLAWRLLRKAAQDLGEWDGPDGVEQGLMGEIIRLANVLVPSPTAGNGWETLPLDSAMSQGLLDEEDRDMVLNALVFFTVSSLMLPRRMQGQDFRQDYLAGASRLWAARISPLGLMAFADSLKTLTANVSIGETQGTA